MLPAGVRECISNKMSPSLEMYHFQFDFHLVALACAWLLRMIKRQMNAEADTSDRKKLCSQKISTITKAVYNWTHIFDRTCLSSNFRERSMHFSMNWFNYITFQRSRCVTDTAPAPYMSKRIIYSRVICSNWSQNIGNLSSAPLRKYHRSSSIAIHAHQQLQHEHLSENRWTHKSHSRENTLLSWYLFAVASTSINSIPCEGCSPFLCDSNVFARIPTVFSCVCVFEK